MQAFFSPQEQNGDQGSITTQEDFSLNSSEASRVASNTVRQWEFDPRARSFFFNFINKSRGFMSSSISTLDFN
jgi:hypothetical protein